MNYKILISDGYKDDSETRVHVIDADDENGGVKVTKAGVKLLVCRDVARNVFRSYHVDLLKNLREAKS